MWIILALLNAFLVASRDTISKKLLHREVSPLLLGGALFTISGILLAGVIAIIGFPQIGGHFYIAVFVSAFLNVLATICLYRSLKMGDMSLVIPLLSFSSVFAVGTSYVILGEVPSVIGFGGIVLIVVGSYILHWETFGESWREILRRIRSNPASMYILAVAVIYSVSANFDKIGSLNSSPIFYSSALDLLLGISLLLILFLSRAASEKRYIVRDTPWFLLLGALFAVATWAQFTALTLAIVPYVTAVTRAAALFGVINGILFFKEKSGIWRLLGALVILIGVVLIAF